MNERKEELVLLRGVRVPVTEIVVTASRSSGPGGQHVNRTESRISLRFSVARSPSMPDAERAMLLERLSARLTQEGELLVHCDEHRVRSRNLATALQRLETMLREAMRRPKVRRATRPSRSSVEARLGSKQRQGQRKRDRRRPSSDD